MNTKESVSPDKSKKKSLPGLKLHKKFGQDKPLYIVPSDSEPS